MPPPCKPSQFSSGTVLLGNDGFSKWQVGTQLLGVAGGGRVEWECVDRAGLPLQPKRPKRPERPATKLPAAKLTAVHVPEAPLGGDVMEAWVCCDSCGKWRTVPHAPVGNAAWFCSMHPDPNLSRCDAPAEAGDVAEAAEAAEEFYGVERLLGRRGIGRNVKYLVRWSGYGKDHDSWEAAANICDPALVRAFEADERRLGSEEALREEALTLVPSSNTNRLGTGYAGVQRPRSGRRPTSRPSTAANGERFACTARDGKFLGEFHSAKAAAHAYARDLGSTASAAAAAAAARVSGSAAGGAAADAAVAGDGRGGAVAASAAGTSAFCEELSEVEKLRARNISDNDAQMRHLFGLDEGSPLKKPAGATSEQKTEAEAEAAAEAEEEAAAAEVEVVVAAMVAQLERAAAAAAAVRCAEEEGLTLAPAVGNASGFHNVTVYAHAAGPSYRAIAYRHRQTIVLGTFGTAEEAALCIARRLGPAKSREVYESRKEAVALQGVPIRFVKPVNVALHVEVGGRARVRLRPRKQGGSRSRTAKVALSQLTTSLHGDSWVGCEPGGGSGAAACSEEEPAPKRPRRAASSAISGARPVAVASRVAVAVHGRLTCPAFMAALSRSSLPQPTARDASAAPEPRASLLPGAAGSSIARRRAAVSDAHQVSVPPSERLVPSWRGPSAGSPPHCGCGEPSVWSGRCAVCASGRCAFLAEVPPDPFTPLCGCGLPCVWARRRWWCGQWGGASGDGCGFEGVTHAVHAPPICVSPSELSRTSAEDMAALLTASAFGISAWAFVAPADCGLGLYARQVTTRPPPSPPARRPLATCLPPACQPRRPRCLHPPHSLCSRGEPALAFPSRRICKPARRSVSTAARGCRWRRCSTAAARMRWR